MSTPERYCSTLQRTHSELYFENWKAERFSKTLTVIRFNLVQFSPSFLLNCCVSYMSLQCFERLFFILLSLVSSCQWKNSETVLSSTVERNLVLCNFWKKKHTYFFIKILTFNTNPNNPYKTVDQVLLVPELLSCPGTSWRQVAHESSSMDEYCWPGLSSVW